MVYTSVYTKKSLYIHQKKQLFSMRWGVAIAMIPLRSQEVLSSEWHSNCQEPDAHDFLFQAYGSLVVGKNLHTSSDG